MNPLKNRKTKVITMFRFIIFAFIGCVALNLTNQQMQINRKKLELEKIQSDLATQSVSNQKLSEMVTAEQKDDPEYIEKIARDELNLAEPGERVFVTIAGN
ncbi:MAG: septum formation initiator family protein [Oscillospiraceae bacterium]|jgi:cell division protein FtsB|nr:septum formation initiator family protein [Oscillospiraceae bacterium]